MNFNIRNDKTETIELDSTSYLVVKVTEYHPLGQSIAITQLFKKAGKVKEGGTIFFPLNTLGYSAINVLGDFYEDISTGVSSATKFNEWLKRPVKTKQIDEFKEKLRVLAPPELAYTIDIGDLSKDRLVEPIPNSPFIIEDVVFAIQQRTPFAEQLKIPLNQMKPIIYYGLIGGRDMITTDVPKILLELNIVYDYKRTSIILNELVDAGLLSFEKRISKNNRRYTVWKFSEGRDQLDDSNKRSEGS